MKYLCLSLVFLLASCSNDELVSGTSKYVTFAQSNQMGRSQDYWLEKRSDFASAEYDKVALILGYGNDYDGCLDIIDALNRKYPTNYYRCIPAN